MCSLDSCVIFAPARPSFSTWSLLQDPSSHPASSKCQAAQLWHLLLQHSQASSKPLCCSNGNVLRLHVEVAKVAQPAEYSKTAVRVCTRARQKLKTKKVLKCQANRRRHGLRSAAASPVHWNNSMRCVYQGVVLQQTCTACLHQVCQQMSTGKSSLQQ